MHDASRVGFRPARREDCRRLWEWRNDPVTREASFDTKHIPYEDHERWFAGKVDAADTRIFIVLDAGGSEVGYVRFTIARERAEISLSIDERKRGQGYGPHAIRAVSDHLLSEGSVRRIVALVKRPNVTSVRAFERAGFVIDGLREIAGGPAYEMTYGEPTRRSTSGGDVLARA